MLFVLLLLLLLLSLWLLLSLLLLGLVIIQTPAFAQLDGCFHARLGALGLINHVHGLIHCLTNIRTQGIQTLLNRRIVVAHATTSFPSDRNSTDLGKTW